MPGLLAASREGAAGWRRPLGRAALLAALALAACSREASERTASGAVRLQAWAHSGRAAERDAMQALVGRFNIGQDRVHLELTFVPEGSYNAQVQAAALAGELPDVLEFDGPFTFNYVWQGQLVPLTGRLPQALRARLIPSIVAQGTYAGELYSVGQFDSGLGLYGRRSALEAAGVELPMPPADAWSVETFEQVLARLAKADPDGQVLDLKLNYEGEWFTYAFAPLLTSAGGGLVTLDPLAAGGVLDGPASVAAMQHVQGWIQRGYVDPDLDDAAFTEGRVALSWVGHWEYRRYADALGDDLVLLPLPDLGQGTRTGQGSWNWGVTTRCADPDAAVRFLEFLLEDDSVLAMCDANAAVPATTTAIARSKLYRLDGPLHLFAEQLTGGYAVPRPRTPAYPVITSEFSEAFQRIRDGADVQATLTRAAAAIDRDIRDNEGYPARPTAGDGASGR